MKLRYRLRRLTVTAVLFPVLFAGAVAAVHADTPRAEIATQVKTYASTDGVKAWTLRYGPREKNQALIQVTDSDSTIDKKILLATTSTTAKDTRYTVQLNGRPYVLLILNGSAGELYVPGSQKSTWVRYDEDLSAQSNPEHYLTDYEQQGKP
ncbi:hypothetical protein SAMN05192589_10293 [Paracidovorax valerianellae]|uniref:Uncharacterized protein n=1 Tax=Paracidovorax valerianellae TaxID=187868 RepID=A0A1G6L860_9BURK|nr:MULTISPECIES: hypothetical protein [Pseudomonadota]MEA9578728.1 hypothetical protein [Xanthomonas nasturtii]SDC39391.1 hypothetical protein SAMN05192589_10293 [Paracidovorax valerianellae]